MSKLINVLLYSSGTDFKTLLVSRMLGQLPNVRIHVLSDTPQSMVRYSRYCDAFHLEYPDFSSLERVDYLMSVAKKHRIHVLFPVSEPEIALCTEFNSLITKYLKTVLLPDHETFQLVSDKGRFASFLMTKKIKTPPTLVCDDSQAFIHALNYVRFPVIFKPIENLGDGKGLQSFKTVDELLDFLEDHPIHFGKSLVQSFIKGQVYSFHGLAEEGHLLAYSSYQCVISPAQRYAPSAGLKFIHDEELVQEGKKAISELNWSGLFNFDYIREEETGHYYLLECNPTVWITAWGTYTAGINFGALTLRHALGETFSPPEYKQVYYTDLKQYLNSEKKASDGYVFRLKDTNWKIVMKDPKPMVQGITSRLKQRFMEKR